ncbi:MAG: hypothetical protein MUF19_03275 [Candidatus Pacebacteria bacterium]|nr:hypothetical protein [Candidatus Paceibacterota bacterium]
MSKIRIDIKNGLVEAEGDVDFVKGVYNDYKDILGSLIALRQQTQDPVLIDNAREVTEKKHKTKDKTKAKTGIKSKESHKIVGDLNLMPVGEVSFKDFYSQKSNAGTSVLSAQEFNAVATYYLKNVIKIANVTPEHIYSCYKDVKKEVPTALTQGLRNTASRTSWIDTGSINDIKMTTAGENMVEHILPKKTEV